MAKFKVSFFQGEDETIEASDFILKDEWFIFADGAGKIKQLRETHVERIDRL